MRKMTPHIGKIIAIISFFLLPALCFPWEIAVKADLAKTDAALPDSIALSSDGPYIIYRPDSSLEILQICNGTLISRPQPAAKEFKFRDLCNISGPEYSVRTKYYTDADSAVDIERIFAVSDIHGEYDYLESLLKNAGVIDKDNHWKWGRGRLVIVGDIFDRGDKVTECLWLIYRLESEAKKAGGDVHYLLGNHELMVLRGDTHYVNEKYTRKIEAESNIKIKDLYGPESVLGRWLRTKSSVIKLNRVLFVHGGLAQAAVRNKESLWNINSGVRRGIDVTSEHLALDSTADFLLGEQGPLWYRGYHDIKNLRYPKATQEQIDSVLEFYGADAIVVGHTEGDEIRGLFGNRIIAIDIPTDELGSLQGVLWEKGKLFKVEGDGHKVLIK
jgi:hypothetical protein